MIKGAGRWLLALALGAMGGPLVALEILVVNDDGATANARAMQRALRDAGHRVLVSVPCQNQSGQGAALRFLQPLGPLEQDCLGGIASVGAPAVGVAGDGSGIHYVDSTPVAALLYGLDVLADAHWGRPPELVISGPNEGHNTGQVNPSSGTVSNAVYAINRGLPALAVSAHRDTAGNALLAGEVAEIVVAMVAELERQRSPGRPLLLAGVGLNVNVPQFAPGEGGALPFARTLVGRESAMVPRFVLDLSTDPAARRRGIDVALPGISFAAGELTAAAAGSEALALREGKITVSVIEGNFGVGPITGWRALAPLAALFHPRP